MSEKKHEEEQGRDVEINVGEVEVSVSPDAAADPQGSRKGKRDLFLPISILIAAVVIGGAVVFSALYHPAPAPVAANDGTAQAAAGQNGGAPGQAPAINTAVMTLASSDVILGDPNAKVTLIEYGDYQCPFCAEFFSQTEPQIIQNYVTNGKVRFVFRDLIVNDRTAQDHESHDSALAVACAADQGKFWAFHDAVYQATLKNEQLNPNGAENDGYLTRARFMGIAQSLGMNQTQFASCYDSGKYANAVQAQSNQATSFGVNATPTFYVNGQQIVGAQPYAAFQQALDAAVAAAK
jgi:protein-disulfide isomerase